MLTWKMEIYQEVGGRQDCGLPTDPKLIFKFFYDFNISLFQLSNIVPLPQVHVHVGDIFHLSTIAAKGYTSLISYYNRHVCYLGLGCAFC